MVNKLRVVIDTNVWLRIILTTKKLGVAAAIWTFFQAGYFQLVTSESLLKELHNTLIAPELAEIHKWPLQQISDYVQSLREISMASSIFSLYRGRITGLERKNLNLYGEYY